jgi:phosphoribosylanthranilate isomerase
MPGSGFQFSDVIQIAGVIDRREAGMVAACGVDLVGIPLRIASGREDLTEDDARDVIGGLDCGTRGVVITYLADAGEIAGLCRKMGTPIVQVHGDIPIDMLAQLKDIDPDLIVIKSLIVRGDNLSQLMALVDDTAPFVEAYITDTFDPASGACGATGRVHDWRVSRAVVEYSPKPVMLAGGLNPDNVRRAILEVGPAGVDAHNGVEDSGGRKSRTLVERFVAEARAAFAARRRGKQNEGEAR